ncbi:MAG: tRNA epoxyqueuosine(34) reductase QueG [Alphaproteobacteria bacterium]|nr:tRNA epoxyqueuosine(34) reductase QueG [Alphaproteobacteria bacterium]MCB9791853.1 tRNA epoxyqueuosine(34) reductase QueG [Alphaproteobacteria bacterium]
MELRPFIERRAAELGFVHVRIAEVPPGLAPRAAEYAAWLAEGRHGDMHYLERGAELRAEPHLRMPGVRSAVVLALEHHHRRPPDPGGLTGKVARYAWGRDYHNLIGKRLRKLTRDLREAGVDCWGGVDTAPILERAWAEAAGLGFSGKNCVQILPARGSWMFLAVLLIDAPLAPDAPLRDHCGRCQRCLDACPTQAFLGPHQLDARRCIAYWTIEARGPIPEPLRAGFGRWVFGCDVCQEVCPHNVRPPEPDEDDLAPRHAWLDLVRLLEEDEEAMMQRFLGTPLRRPGAEGLRRNACVVLGNLGDPDAVPVLRRAAEGPSDLVAEHARWALERLGG